MRNVEFDQTLFWQLPMKLCDFSPGIYGGNGSSQLAHMRGVPGLSQALSVFTFYFLVLTQASVYWFEREKGRQREASM